MRFVYNQQIVGPRVVRLISCRQGLAEGPQRAFPLDIVERGIGRELEDDDVATLRVGAPDAADAITTDMLARRDAVVAAVGDAARPRVYEELDASDSDKPFVAGPNGFYGQLIDVAGGTNVFGDLQIVVTDGGADPSRSTVHHQPETTVLIGLKLNGVRDRAFLRERLEQSLRMAALWDEVRDDLHKPGISLSGGQQRPQRRAGAAGPGSAGSSGRRPTVPRRSGELRGRGEPIRRTLAGRTCRWNNT